MRNYARNLKQQATYWAVTGVDVYGKRTFASPTTVVCRWEEKVQMIVNKQGKEIVSRARVFLVQDIDMDGYLYLGHSGDSDPRMVDSAFEIQMKAVQPDLRGLSQLNVAYL